MWIDRNVIHIYKLNKNGPITEPWGVPARTFLVVEYFPLTWTASPFAKVRVNKVYDVVRNFKFKKFKE